MIIALDMSMRYPSVALIDGEYNVLDEKLGTEDMEHVRAINVMIADLMVDHDVKWSDLSAISFNEGPGSYTGLRVACSAAKAICFAHNLLYIPLRGHHILYHACSENSRNQDVNILISARKGVAFSLVKKKNTDWSDLMKRLTPEEWSSQHDSYFVYHGQELSQVFDSHPHLKGEYIDLSASSQSVLLSHAPRSLSDLRDISSHKPYYFLSPNITTRRKPLLS